MTKELPPELCPNLPPRSRATMIAAAHSVLDELADADCKDAWMLLRCEPDDGLDLTGSFHTLRDVRNFVVASLSVLRMLAEKEGSPNDAALAAMVIQIMGADASVSHGGISKAP